MNKKKFTMISLICLFTALISVGAYIVFPIPGSPVPIVLQNMFILLTGIILGPIWGLGTILLYLFLGIVGLPIFSGGGRGFAHIMGPTGGFLISYVFAVFLIGIISNGKKPSLIRIYIALFSGTCIIYLIGVMWLKFKLDISYTKAIQFGFLPYIIGDTLKVIIAGLLGYKLKPMMNDII